jgi:hypothetical protein
MGIIQNCKSCYWKRVNKDKQGFCYMFEKQMMPCYHYQFDYYLNNKE